MLNCTENKEIEIIYFLAAGLIKLQKKMEKGGTCYPYPNQLRIGLDKLAAVGLEKNIDYPKSISEVIKFFHKPINSWGLVEIEAFKDNEALISRLDLEMNLVADFIQRVMKNIYALYIMTVL